MLQSWIQTHTKQKLMSQDVVIVAGHHQLFVPTMFPLPPGSPLDPRSPFCPASPHRPRSPWHSRAQTFIPVTQCQWLWVFLGLPPSPLTLRWYRSCPAQTPLDECLSFYNGVTFEAAGDERIKTFPSPSLLWDLHLLSNPYHPERRRKTLRLYNRLVVVRTHPVWLSLTLKPLCPLMPWKHTKYFRIFHFLSWVRLV